MKKTLTALLLSGILCSALVPGEHVFAQTAALNDPSGNAGKSDSDTTQVIETDDRESNAVTDAAAQNVSTAFKSDATARAEDTVVKQDGLVFDKATGRITDFDAATAPKSGELIIPKQIDGVEVKEIKSYALGSMKGIKKVVTPNSVSSIGFGVFQMCSDLEEVDFEEGSPITVFPDSLFYSCTKLSKIQYPDNLKSINTLAFYKCNSLVDLTLPDGLQTIYNAAFLDCKNLESVRFPDSLRHLVGNSFEGCTKLKTLSKIPYRCIQFGYIEAEDDGTVNPISDTAVATLYIDQVKGRYTWHEKDLTETKNPTGLTVYFRKPTIEVTNVSVSPQGGYEVEATVSINTEDGFAFQGAIHTPDGQQHAVTQDDDTKAIAFHTDTLNYQVTEIYKEIEDITWNLEIDGFQTVYVCGAEETTRSYLNNEENTYPDLRLLGFEENERFLGWSEDPDAMEATYQAGDPIVDAPSKLYAVFAKETAVNQPPVIHAEDKTLYVGDVFDPMKEVTAFDAEDGDLSAALEIVSQNVDTSKAGTYAVTYQVTDHQGATATKTITITVVEKNGTDQPPVDQNKPGQDAPETKPTAPSVSGDQQQAPQTADSVALPQYLAMLILSAVGGVGLWTAKKRRS